ncbi:MAG: response regulator transcription factor [Chloroflexi bacterium]|nr:response regulator transcription factor [Chloroflexota bacterium]
MLASQTIETYDPLQDPAIRVMIVDDQPVFREVARAILESDGQFNVVAEADGGTEAVNMMPDVQPDVVIMDIQMGDISGIEATRRILGRTPDASVVLTSMTAEREYPRLVREIGALGFIAKRNLNGAALRSVLGLGPGTMPAMAA